MTKDNLIFRPQTVSFIRKVFGNLKTFLNFSFEKHVQLILKTLNTLLSVVKQRFNTLEIKYIINNLKLRLFSYLVRQQQREQFSLLDPSNQCNIPRKVAKRQQVHVPYSQPPKEDCDLRDHSDPHQLRFLVIIHKRP